MACGGVPACKDGPALQRSNSGVTAHLVVVVVAAAAAVVVK